MICYRVLISGQVQGLGFRPHVYRLARLHGVRGTVSNSRRGVEIIVQGRRARGFIDHLRKNPPPLARIIGFSVSTCKPLMLRGFSIVKSLAEPGTSVEVLPDIASCQACRRDVVSRSNRRHRYPFTNCTQCGPRYTIIEELPYDRPRTTMKRFQMCPACAAEYSDPTNRRFHAQPNACPACGPSLRLLQADGQPVAGDPLEEAARALISGRILALRSLGGFQLACDATNDRAVARLRRRKRRPAKPLALMCESAAVAARFCRITRQGRAMLTSPAAPIVLCRRRPAPQISVSQLVAPSNRRCGVMLTYTPLHTLLFATLHRTSGGPAVLVMTSANRREDPIIADLCGLQRELAGVPDFILDHDRPIANRCDDSVVSDGSKPVFVRRARGYAPQSIRLDPVFHVKHPTLALGGELRNCFALAVGDRVLLSPHIGSLASPSAEQFFAETLQRYLSWAGIVPTRIACDLHPDYLSTRLAERLARERSLRLYRVQHHFAHAASVAAEQGLQGRFLALAFDGTGYGTDGSIWGCEFLAVDQDLRWRRVGHLAPLRLLEPSGELANPLRVAACYLQQSGASPRLRLGPGADEVRRRLAAGEGVLSSSLGRLFDAVSAIAGIKRAVSFEGEAAIALESTAAVNERGRYRCGRIDSDADGVLLLRPEPLLTAVADDVACGTPARIVAARFQNAIVDAAARMAATLARDFSATAIALTGGAFQNDRLRSGIAGRLQRSGWRVCCNQLIPLNDGGIALGQAVAAARLP